MNAKDQNFEKYRRERNRRRLETGGPRRPMGANATVLRELEEAENREALNQRLAREVQEFFADATRQAASMVSNVTQSVETDQAVSVTKEMSDFLTDTLARAQEFVQLVTESGVTTGVSHQDLEPKMHNLVGHALDSFRFEGNSKVSEDHIGRDPFAEQQDTDAPAAAPAPAAVQAAPEVAAAAAEPEPEEASVATMEEPAFVSWWNEVAADDQVLRTALRALVAARVMTKDVGHAIWSEVRSER